MLDFKTLNLDDALLIIGAVRREAEEAVSKGRDKPVAIAVIGLDGRLIAFVAMDGVTPVSIQLAINKAHTAIVGSRDTVEWEGMGVDAQNFTDPQFTCFGGGVLVRDRKGNIVGAAGVSGRKSKKPKKDVTGIPQDHELADMGSVCFRTGKLTPG
jgi:glc operon protein GlcG